MIIPEIMNQKQQHFATLLKQVLVEALKEGVELSIIPTGVAPVEPPEHWLTNKVIVPVELSIVDEYLVAPLAVEAKSLMQRTAPAQAAGNAFEYQIAGQYIPDQWVPSEPGFTTELEERQTALRETIGMEPGITRIDDADRTIVQVQLPPNDPDPAGTIETVQNDIAAAVAESGEPGATVDTPAETAAEPEIVTTASGLRYQELTVGTGQKALVGYLVNCHYTGWLQLEDGAQGPKFDSSLDRNDPFQFALGNGQVIRGWDEGIQGMLVGGKRKLFVPADLGYGSRGAGNVIPPNSDLIFEVELLGIY